MRLDDEERPGRLGFLILALAGAFMLLFLVGGRTPTSALSYNGGQGGLTRYSMTSNWSPTLAAASDEFTTDSSASWTLQAAGGIGTTLINPNATPSASLFNFATYRVGWLFLQAESATGAAVASKAYTLPSGIALWSRVKYATRGVTPASNDGVVGIGFAATSGGVADTANMVFCSLQTSTSNGTGRALVRIQAGAATYGASSAAGSAAVNVPQYRDVILIQRRDNNYFCYTCIDAAGSCTWTGTLTWGGAATLDRVMIYARNEAATAPGPLTHALDYFRVVESSNAFP